MKICYFWRKCSEAVFWDRQENRPSLEELFAIPEIAKILQNWNEREGDFSLIAVDEFNKLLGAAWYRFWTSSNHSYGFVDEDIPELGIAVKLEVRRMGIGKTLMNAIMKHAGEIDTADAVTVQRIRIPDWLVVRLIAAPGTEPVNAEMWHIGP